MNELSPQARAILEATREAHLPTDADRERVRSALLVQLAVVGSVGTLAAPAAAGASTAAGSTTGGALTSASFLTTAAGKVLACVALVGVVGTGTAVGVVTSQRAEQRDGARHEVAARRHATCAVVAEGPAPGETAAAPALVTAPEPAPAPVVASEPAVPVTATASSPSARRATARQATAPAPSPPEAPGMAEEVRLLREAHAALRAGDGARAMALLDEGAARFPAGALREERAASRVVALCRLGRTDEGAAAAREFLGEWPASPLAARVRAACPATPEQGSVP